MKEALKKVKGGLTSVRLHTSEGGSHKSKEGISSVGLEEKVKALTCAVSGSQARRGDKGGEGERAVHPKRACVPRHADSRLASCGSRKLPILQKTLPLPWPAAKS